MKTLIIFSTLFLLSCTQPLSLNSTENLNSLKSELQEQLGQEEFSTLLILTKDRYGVVKRANFDQVFPDKPTVNFDYDFSEKKISEKRIGVTLPTFFGKKEETSKADLKYKKFKISDIDFSKVRESYDKASSKANAEKIYDEMVLHEIRFEDRPPSDGKLDISFSILATKDGKRKEYQELHFQINDDGSVTPSK